VSNDNEWEVNNPSANETFDEVQEARLSRRAVLGGGLAIGAAAVAAGTVGGGVGQVLAARPAVATGYPRPGTGPLLGFTGIPTSTADTVVVPPGYSWDVLISWGDPVSNGPAFKPDASNSSADQERQWGMHNDGIVYFPFGFLGNWRGLIVQNCEYTDDGLLFPDGVANWTAEKTRKSQAAHGVAIIEVFKTWNGEWKVKRPSPYARRITAYTPVAIGGPAAGHPLLKTGADPRGTKVLGTVNNCAMGYTPWGTYLACEENFNGYFRKTTAGPLEARYGIGTSSEYRWYTTDTRFDLDVEPNEANRFGWVTEIDPWKPKSTPVKRTALGRLKHEGAWVEEADDGRVVVYMGDDQVFEYIYRYVSKDPWRVAFRKGRHPLDDGTLYVARFNADGTGDWLPLTKDNPALAGFATQADILINTRAAADAVGATKMDRPEWIDVIDSKKEVYVTLTNNSGRGTGTNPGVDGPNPRVANRYGQIVRWDYANDFTDPVFYWEIFALAGDPAVATTGSTIVGDKYGSPDGLYAAPSGRLWIQTDVSSSTIDSGVYAGFGNNQMLCADPETKETRRFLVGPAKCEITGCFASPDERALFVGIQHPGERPDGLPGDPAAPAAFSSWPGGPGTRPRSSLIVITKDDGGKIGT
jgi:uncharacterized protein